MKPPPSATPQDPALKALHEELRMRKERNTSTRDKLAQFRERLRVLSIENKLMESWKTRLQQHAESLDSRRAEEKRTVQGSSSRSPLSPQHNAAAAAEEQGEKGDSDAALTLEQKYAVCMSEIEDLTQQIHNTTKASEAALKLTKALADDSEVEIAEIRRDAFEFRRDVVVNGEDARTGHTVAEKLLKWLEDRLARKDINATKLKLQLHHFKQQTKAPARRRRNKEEAGNDLHYIDFHQLQIENEQFAAKIEEANKEVLKQKSTCAKTLEHQVHMKQALQLCVEETKRLEAQTTEKKALLNRAKVDVHRAVKEKEASRNENKNSAFGADTVGATASPIFHQALQPEQRDGCDGFANFFFDCADLYSIAMHPERRGLHILSRATLQVPQILDYVDNKATEYDLLKKVKNWRRKVEVSELETDGSTRHPQGLLRRQTFTLPAEKKIKSTKG